MGLGLHFQVSWLRNLRGYRELVFPTVNLEGDCRGEEILRLAENLQVGLKRSAGHLSRQRRTAVVPCGLGLTGQLFMCSRITVRVVTVQAVMDEEDSLVGGRGQTLWRCTR